MSTFPHSAPKLLTLQDYLDNFPFPEIRPKQLEVLEQICDAFNSGYQYIVLEAPTGFGKSPVAVCVAKTLGSSYVCCATNELQNQYSNDFPYFLMIKGMDNFLCLVKEDFERNHNYRCPECGPNVTFAECKHTTVVRAPCQTDQPGFAPSYDHDELIDPGCRYKPAMKDYRLINPGTIDEIVAFTGDIEAQVRNTKYPWSYFLGLNNPRINFPACEYYNQRNKGLLASHTILNYSNFQIFLRISPTYLRSKELLVLDEGHLIEQKILDFTEISISKWALSRYLSPANTMFIEDFLLTHGYDDDIKTVWVSLFLEILCTKIIEDIPYLKTDEQKTEAKEYLDNLKWKIDELSKDPDNWIVTDIDIKKHKVKFRPIDISKYCGSLFNKCHKTLIMSATILDVDAFCRSVGLSRDKVKFIIIADSDFPVQNRPIYALNTEYLNRTTVYYEKVQRNLVRLIDLIMNRFNDVKGIIHTTTYEQVEFIQKYLSLENKKRLIATDTKIKRELVVSNHFDSDKPSVLISPSMRLGLDLKDDRSRFQIIVKVPYPAMGKKDRWTTEKMGCDPDWYQWQTALSLVQAYGRSVRSKDDWAYTFILDSCFESFLRRNNSKLPKWFTEAIRRKGA